MNNFRSIVEINAERAGRQFDSAETKKQKKPARVETRHRAKRLTREERKISLLICALEVCAANGISSACHREIAKRANVSVPTVFHYFPNKEQLTSSVLAEVHRFLIDEVVKPHLKDGDNANESVLRILLAFAAAVDERPHHIRIWLEWSASVREGMWEQYLKFYKAAIDGMAIIVLRGQVEGVIRHDLDADDAARVIVGVAHLVAHMKYAGNSTGTIKHTLDSLVNGYLSCPSKYVEVEAHSDEVAELFSSRLETWQPSL